MSKPLCPQCREPIPEGAPDGMCPRCLFSLGIAAVAVSSSDAVSMRGLGALGDYELLEVIARGGMGIVFRARQISLNRIVAVKLMVAGHFAAPAIVKRFKVEAEAAARLEHPHIVPIYEVAEHLGQPYFSMRFMDGGTLAERISDRKPPISNREAAQLMATVARAVHYAHERGILHRDLKPTNILLDTQGQPHLTDFGLAKLLEEDSSLTLTFAILGTPAYMAPEQAAGKAKDLTTAADLYGLGAILYELLTGQPPFAGKTPAEVMRQVVDAEPTPPRKLNPVLDEDLETICLKCLEKEPARRYPSALALAEELERWLRHEPIHARPSTAWNQAGKWIRRRPAVAGLVALTVLLLLGGVAGIAWQAVRATRHAEAETHLRHHAESNEFQLRHTVYAADMMLAAQALERGDDETARHTLARHKPVPGEQDFRGWEWRYFWQAAQGDPGRSLVGHTNTVTGVEKFDGGRRLLSCSYDGTVREWDFATGRELRRWSLPGVQWRKLAVHPSGTNAVAVTHGDRAFQIDLVTGKERVAAIKPASSSFSIVASPDGHAYLHSAAGWGFTSTNGVTFVRNLNLNEATELPESGSRCAFAPNGRLLATGTWHDRIKLWSWPEQKVTGDLGPVVGVASLAFSPDGRWLVSGAMLGELCVWDVAERTLLHRRVAHKGTTVGSVKFSPDGRLLATAGGDQTLVIWDAKTLEPRRVLRGYVEQVWQLQWAEDGKSLISTTRNNGIRVWNLDDSGVPNLTGLEPLRPLRFSVDGRYIGAELMGFVAGAMLWSVPEGRELKRWSGDLEVYGFLPKSDLFLFQRRNTNVVTFCRVPGGEVVRELVLEDGDPQQIGVSAELSPDGRHLAWACDSGIIPVWDIATGKRVSTLQAHKGKVQKVLFSRDSRWLLSGGEDGIARLWAATTWREVMSFTGPASTVWEIAFSANGERLAVGWLNGKHAVFDRVTGRRIAEFNSLEDGLGILPDDGQTLITIGPNRLRFWSVASQREAGTVSLSASPGMFLTLSPDGSRLAFIPRDNTLRLFRAPLLETIPGR